MTIRPISFLRWAVLTAPACAALSGCMSTTPIFDSHFGESVKAISQAQIIDPDAAIHHPSTSGIDGKAAVAAMSNYNASFQQPTSTSNPFVIGVGGSGSSGGGGGMPVPSSGQ